MWRSLRELWEYRELGSLLVSKELKLRYRRSVLGLAWTMLNPLLTMLILTVVFSHAMRIQVDHFPVFLLSALLPWNFFAQSVGSGGLSVIQNERLFRNIRVPRAIFPLAYVSSHLMNLLLALVPLAVVMLWQRVAITPAVLVLPWFVVALWAFTCGLTLALSAASVFLRDLTQIVQVGLTALFYLTPVIYPLSLIPDSYRSFFQLNPILYVGIPFRTIFLDGVVPGADVFLLSGILGSTVFLVGLAAFRSREHLFLQYLS